MADIDGKLAFDTRLGFTKGMDERLDEVCVSVDVLEVRSVIRDALMDALVTLFIIPSIAVIRSNFQQKLIRELNELSQENDVNWGMERFAILAVATAGFDNYFSFSSSGDGLQSAHEQYH